MHVRACAEADRMDVSRIQACSPEAGPSDFTAYPQLIATLGGCVAGFLAWRETAPDEAEILTLAVDPQFRRMGAASALIAAIPAMTIFLEVRESNRVAREVYRRAGFSEAGVRFGYYNHPPEAAIVMRLKR